LPTRLASQQLGMSGETLRRLARNGVLEIGTHFRPGLTATSPWLWDSRAIETVLLQIGGDRIA
jgi:hypothetical protein